MKTSIKHSNTRILDMCFEKIDETYQSFKEADDDYDKIGYAREFAEIAKIIEQISSMRNNICLPSHDDFI